MACGIYTCTWKSVSSTTHSRGNCAHTTQCSKILKSAILGICTMTYELHTRNMGFRVLEKIVYGKVHFLPNFWHISWFYKVECIEGTVKLWKIIKYDRTLAKYWRKALYPQVTALLRLKQFQKILILAFEANNACPIKLHFFADFRAL